MGNMARRMKSIQKYCFISALTLLILLPFCCSTTIATDVVSESDYQANTFHDFVIESFTSEIIELNCVEGQILSGKFEVYCDGRLYPGDDQRYDDWMLESIQFLILNETEYDNYNNDLNFTPSYQRNTQTLSWQFKVTSTGKWYIVYYNPSIYLITIQGSIDQGLNNDMMVVSILLASPLILILVFLHIRKGR